MELGALRIPRNRNRCTAHRDGTPASVLIFEDPHYAPAYAGIADAYSLLAEYGFQVPDQAMPKARTAALRALEIDDGLAEHLGVAIDVGGGRP